MTGLRNQGVGSSLSCFSPNFGAKQTPHLSGRILVRCFQSKRPWKPAAELRGMRCWVVAIVAAEVVRAKGRRGESPSRCWRSGGVVKGDDGVGGDDVVTKNRGGGVTVVGLRLGRRCEGPMVRARGVGGQRDQRDGVMRSSQQTSNCGLQATVGVGLAADSRPRSPTAPEAGR